MPAGGLSGLGVWERHLPDAVGSCQDPVFGHQGPSAGVAPLAVGVVLQGDLGRGAGGRSAARP